MTNRKIKQVNPTFKFWLENKVNQERQYFASDMRQSFQKWLIKQNIEWLEYYSCEQVVLSFITSKEGLNSTHDPKDTDDIVYFLKPEYQKRILNSTP